MKPGLRGVRIVLFALLAGAPLAPAMAQSSSDYQALRAQLQAALQRIQVLEQRLDSLPSQQSAAPSIASANSSSSGGLAPLRPVVEAPKDIDRAPEIAVLGQQGALITRRGQLTGEFQLDYTRADRNRALFRGVALLDTLLIGIFDINESHRDLVEGSFGLRYGLTDRFEIGARVPFVHRSDSNVLAPVRVGTNADNSDTIEERARGNGIGDVEATLRYQLTRPSAGKPFLVANLQGVAPTGSSPFTLPRDDLGRELKAATGAGFWSVAPSVTAILPTDPALLFGTLGYTHNFGRSVNTQIGGVRLTRVDPGDSISASAGIGLALNDRTSLNLGYSHNWTFGTRTTTEPINASATTARTTTRARDLQIGRLLFGVTYRVTDAASVNWGVEVGATNDAPDVRTTLRIPLTLIEGH